MLNVTPDSFSDGGLYRNLEDAVTHASRMIDDGADIIDIGGESTRPGATHVDTEEELARVLPVVRAVAREAVTPISVDTSKAAVARAALDEGATFINDVSALTNDPDMARVIADSGCGVCLMHMRGNPRNMQRNPRYTDVVTEVSDYLSERAAAAAQAGIDRSNIVIDPGFGFGKTVEHNLELLRHLGTFCELGYPVLIGPSRKSTIGMLLGGLPPTERVEGTAAAVAIAIANGAALVRVHDVKAMARVAAVTDAIVRRVPLQPARATT